MKNFKLSHGWIYRFKKRYNIISRAQTTTSKCQAANKENARALLHSARMELVNKIKKLGVPAYRIGNCDQTKFRFEPLPGFTLDFKGRKSVPINALQNEKSGFTVHLALTSSGNKIPPLIIFKGKGKLPPKIEIPEDKTCFICCSPSSWINKNIFSYWLQEVWYPAVKKKTSILVLDNFGGNIADSVLTIADKLNITLFRLPSGTTSISQPLDHHIIAKFKRRFYQKYNEWRQEKDPNFTQPAYKWRNQCVEWVCDAWYNGISVRTIRRAFKATITP